jgi:putative Mg2+ transporter-C (MgtC) family protein
MAELDLVIKVLVAGLLGFIIGIERELMGSPAGDRTFSLVALGSALFTALSMEAFGGGSPDRVASNIVTGVGFLGGGMILKEGNNVRGLTTAAGMWATAAVGMAVATDHYVVAVVASVVIMLLFAVERVYSLKRKPTHREDGEAN